MIMYVLPEFGGYWGFISRSVHHRWAAFLFFDKRSWLFPRMVLGQMFASVQLRVCGGGVIGEGGGQVNSHRNLALACKRLIWRQEMLIH